MARVDHVPGPINVATDAAERRVFAALSAGIIYVLWVATTYFLEGRTHLLERVDPVGRSIYALVANIAIGTVLAIAAVRTLGLPPYGKRRPSGRKFEAAIATFALVAAVAVRVGDAMVLVNAAAQVLPTSMAEVAVCWALVGGVTKRAVRPFGKRASVIAAIALSDVAFAAYHVAHSSPFDRPAMMLFLLLPGLVIGVLVFVIGSPLLAVLAETAFAVLGMAQNVDMSAFHHPSLAAFVLAAGSLAAYTIIQKLPVPSRVESMWWRPR